MDSGQTTSESHSSKRLSVIFLAWKSALALLATFCPGPGYDSSGLVLLDGSNQRYAIFAKSSLLEKLTLNLLRWDALYFVKAAQRDYIYEQEWAFSWAHSHILRAVGDFTSEDTNKPLKYYIWAGTAVSNVCHLLSVLVMNRLLSDILGPQQNRRLPFIASVLHVFSPASMFLCAPYAEGLFSLLNFTGMLLYVRAHNTTKTQRTWSLQQDVYMLGSGILFALATLIRSNGLLSGLILLYDVARALPTIFAFRLNKHDVHRLFVTCAAGSLIAIGFLLPQALAYRTYCKSSPDNELRPWCNNTLPSIYSWVQSHYWNVGFLRYWTLSNIPLFLLAAPMIWLLSITGTEILQTAQRASTADTRVTQNQRHLTPHVASAGICSLPQLALPQLVLAVTATTNYHVQIINRIASGYPIWYMVIAKWIVDESSNRGTEKRNRMLEWVVRGIVMYTIVQGVLFANFLPPA